MEWDRVQFRSKGKFYSFIREWRLVIWISREHVLLDRPWEIYFIGSLQWGRRGFLLSLLQQGWASSILHCWAQQSLSTWTAAAILNQGVLGRATAGDPQNWGVRQCNSVVRLLILHGTSNPTTHPPVGKWNQTVHKRKRKTLSPGFHLIFPEDSHGLCQ